MHPGLMFHCRRGECRDSIPAPLAGFVFVGGTYPGAKATRLYAVTPVGVSLPLPGLAGNPVSTAPLSDRHTERWAHPTPCSHAQEER